MAKTKATLLRRPHPTIVWVQTVALIVFLPLIGMADDYAAARRSYYEAVDGDKAAAGRASSALDAMRRSKPEDSLLLVYRGSLFLLESSRSIAPWRKGKLAKEGLSMMDRAVALAPGDVEVRFVRAASTARLPGFFRRGNESAEDFAKVASKAGEAVRAGKLEPRLAAAALFYHAEHLENGGDRVGSQQACRTALKVGPGTAGARDCGVKLRTQSSSR